jgi:hypothetical protein|tara:strand:- start:81 stop:317 length:237 start_codon:yes stop_codon:yes gene_type:complete
VVDVRDSGGIEMDRREMKKKMQMALIRELWQNQKNKFGETRQEVILSKMNIYDPSEAVERRFRDLVTEIFRSLQQKEN